MGSVYDIVTVTCFACVVVTYYMFPEGGTKVLAHFMLPTAAFAIAINWQRGHERPCGPRTLGGAVSQPQTCE